MDTAGNCCAQDGMKTVRAASLCRQSTRHNDGFNTYLLYSNPIFYPELVVCESDWILCYTFDIKGATGYTFVMNHISCSGLPSSYHTTAGVLMTCCCLLKLTPFNLSVKKLKYSAIICIVYALQVHMHTGDYANYTCTCMQAHAHTHTHTELQAELIKHVCYKKQNSIMPLDFKTGTKSEEFW